MRCQTRCWPRWRAPRFTGKSQFKTWVLGFIKHKVLDQPRLRQRKCPYDSDVDDEPLEDLVFKPDGQFQTRHRSGMRPPRCCNSPSFSKCLRLAWIRCLGKLAVCS